MYAQTPTIIYLAVLRNAQDTFSHIRNATTPVRDMPKENVTYYVADNGRSGYGVTDSGELIGVFSVDKGNGSELIQSAIENGATHLDCFDGYLPTFYARNGFTETHRVDNWIVGKPDVVYMRLAK